ncbi:MAG TPA: ZIP family metal transporter [Candidatus Paceibacterota bacterium]|nr:ZIP family metal transporter [Candidatus Paceibacterota bacterium]
MSTPIFEAFISVFLVSAASLAGIAALFTAEKDRNGITFALVSLSVGVLFGDALLHILPDLFASGESVIALASLVFAGIMLFFVLEKYLHVDHEHGFHEYGEEAHRHGLRNRALGTTILAADIIHNFLDGLIVGASYLGGAKLGLATTLAVVFHEIPHEMGNVGVLLHAGYSKKKAFWYNTLTALTAFFGLACAVFFGQALAGFTDYALAFAAGGFIYIAGSELVPELREESGFRPSLVQFACMILGFGIMALVLLLE